MKFGVIGYGYWGPNVVRNLESLEDSRVLAIAEMSPAARARAQKAYPGIKVTPDASDVFLSAEIDAVAIVTPGVDALRASQGGAGEWQACVCGETIYQQCRARGGTDQPRATERT